MRARVRGHRVVWLVALALVVSLVPAHPPEAAAALTNVWPSDGYGDIYPSDMSTADALFVYVTSDSRGGRVCVVAAEGEGSCDVPAWGSPNTIVGIGTLYSLLEGPPLTAGTWRLRTESRGPDGVWVRDAESDVFRIRPCTADECLTSIGRQQADAFKEASARATGLARGACAAFAVKEVVDQVTGLHSTVKGGVEVLGTRGADFRVAGGTYIAGVGGGLLGFSLPSVNPGEDIALRILKELSCQVAQMHDDIANDPPDPTIHEVEPPSFDDPPDLPAPELTDLASTLDRQAGHGIAARIAYERYQAAVEVGDLVAQRLQATAAAEQAFALAREMRATAVAMRTVADSDADGFDLGSPLFTESAPLAELREVLDRVRAEGLRPDEVTEVLALGFDEADLPGIVSHLDLDLDALTPGTSLADVLHETADGLEEAVEGTDLFARTAEVVATSDLAAPTAAIEEVTGGSDWRRLRAVATSPDGDPLTYHWDLGDGTTATGEEIEHTWTRSGTYTVRLTVTETTPWGSTATAQVQVAISVNSPPRANDDTLNVPLGGSATVDLLANDVDSDGDPISFVGIDEAHGGSLSCTDAGVCTYTADRGVVGTETLTYRITDGTDEATGVLRVTIVDAQPPISADLEIALSRGSSFEVRLPAEDPEPGPQPLTAEIVDPPEHLTVTPRSTQPVVLIGVPWDAPAEDRFTYRVTDGANVSTVATVTVRILDENQPPVARDVALTTPAGQPVSVTLDGEDPDGTPVTYQHGTVPGGRITGTAPNLVFDPQDLPPGTYTFSYTVSDGALTSDPATVTIEVGPPAGGPIVELGPDLTLDEGYITLSGTARDPDGGPLTYLWDLGDGRTFDQPTVLTFLPAGTYAITLTVTDQLGRTSSDSMVLTLRNRPPTVSGPFVSGGPYVPGQQISFGAVGSDPGGGPVSYRWDLGDGTVLEGEDVSGNLQHRYDDPGTYLVRVTVTDTHGATASVARTIVVQPFVVDAGPDLVLPEGEEVELQVTTDPAFPFPLSQLRWDLGDGSPEVTGQAVVRHRYEGDGPRTARVTATWAGVSVSDEVEITFTNLPPRLGPALPLVVEAGATHTLHAGASDPGGDPVTVTWDLGDEGVAEGQRVQHAWADPGSYTVRIEAVDDEGAAASAVAVVNVVPVGSLERLPIASRGRDYHLAFDRNVTRSESGQYLMITGEARTTGTVSVPHAGFRAEFAIIPGRVSFVRLPEDTVPPGDPPISGVEVDGRAVMVHARRPVTVYGVNRQPFTTDAFLAVPDHLAGTRYRALGYRTSLNAQVTVTALEPDTEVRHRDLNGGPVEAQLEAGEVLRVQHNDPAGILVEGDGPLQVASGSRCGLVPTGRLFCDHLVEASWPTAMWGQRFLTVPLATRTGDTFRVVADEEDTVVRIDGEVVATLAAGGVHEQVLYDAHEITTSGPAAVVQFSNGTAFDGAVGDPFMMTVPPFEQWLDRYTIASADAIRANFLNVVVRDGGQDHLRLDGDPVDAGAFSPIGDSGYVGAQLEVDAGEHRLVGDRPFALSVYGFDDFDSYGYPAGLAMARVAEVSAIELSPGTGERQIGTDDCPVATVTDAAGGPIDGARVDLTVAGANATERFAFTGPDGTATLCYPGATGGTSSLVARVGGRDATGDRTWVSATPPVNSAPTASDVAVSTPAGTPVTVTLAGDDPDDDPLTFAVETGPTGGTLGPVEGDRVTYTPDPGFTGTDTFTYRAHDGTTSSAPATVTITVTPASGSPTTVELDPAAATAEVGSEDCTTITVRDPAGELLSDVPVTVSVTGANSAGELLETAADGTTVFCYVGTAAGEDVLVATAGEVGEQAIRNWTTADVPDPNRPPVAASKRVEVRSGEPVDIVLPVSDPDGDPLTVTLVEPPAHGTLAGLTTGDDAAPSVPATDGSFALRYTSLPGYVGEDRFRYRVSDGLAEVVGTVELDVLPPTDTSRPGACRGRTIPRAPFADVPGGNVHRDAIDCAVHWGIANGRSPAEYAPATPVTRAQMASFVARLIEAGGGALPPATPQGFEDLAAAGVHRARIEQLVAAGVVRGRTATSFAPGAPVTRAQMATFLVGAYEHVAATTLPEGEVRFRDIGGHPHERNIRRAGAAGFALGRTETHYDPQAAVRRDQMASFLTRVLERHADEGQPIRRVRDVGTR